ncbi:hypothetical protein LOSG293_110010 [Secundilactobacillus oryzae JCM 18671]|uniref:Uncharacterized protein n=1 Tax=Secundilactobacillus oryzae JCM 18671 TaxID=1291743 RepID=A0A081BI17_9LACO|nr:hypothetical protein [Secundilactobacillus oryzae]GAK47685.1 hypothetical protein LOSG293_110010 [Secundilactobacillus oryzae JCM 18671]
MENFTDPEYIRKQLPEDIKILNERIGAAFKRLPKTQYNIMIVDFKLQPQKYNIFVNAFPKGRRIKSTPVHSIDIHDLDYLEKVIDGIEFQLTKVYRGFDETAKWPSTGKPIINLRGDNIR